MKALFICPYCSYSAGRALHVAWEVWKSPFRRLELDECPKCLGRMRQVNGFVEVTPEQANRMFEKFYQEWRC